MSAGRQESERDRGKGSVYRIGLKSNKMKKLNIRHFIILTFLMAILFQGYSQITVTKVENKNINSSQEGFIYSLPQTVFRIDIVYETVQNLKGPLSEYTDEYLGATDYISSNKTKYNLVDVSVSTFQEADPGQLYHVHYPSERAKDEEATSFSLSDIGSLLAYNTDAFNKTHTNEVINDQTIIFNEGDDAFPYMSQYNKQKKTDTIVRKINIDTITINRFLFKSSWIDKSMSEKAREAALQIEKIRESRYQLISGYQEVNYGSSIVYMDKQLHELEKQYLELFLGRELKSIETQSFYYLPNKNKKVDELMRFEDGNSVVIKLALNKNSENLPDNTTSKINSVYYRIPVSADVSISSENKDFFIGRYIINQLGVVSSVPLGGTKLQFDAQTGNLVTIIRE